MKWIRKYGFETFPELFDESYDEEKDLTRRTKIIIENLKKLRGKSTNELQGLLEMVKPKIIHNKKILKTYANGGTNKELLNIMKLALDEQVRNVL